MKRALRRRVRDPAIGVGVVAAAWYVAPLAFGLMRSALHGLTFIGPEAGLFPVDQLRYLAWIREAGLHGLIADPYRSGAPHVYLHPLFLVSGLLWRAGLSVEAAYLVWTPVALLVLVWGYCRFIRGFLSGHEWIAALTLSLLFFSPLVPALDWGKVVDALGANDLVIVAGHAAPYWQAWGFLPTVIALGLMPVYLLSVEALLNGGNAGLRRVIETALIGVLAAWLHPWGGIELVAITSALLVVRRLPPGSGAIALVSIATALPLIYYAVLATADSAWSLSQLRTGSGVAPMWWPLLAALGPLLLVSLPALRGAWQPPELTLVLWPVAALLVYVTLGQTSRVTALEGVGLPLSVLAVRGWRRLSLPRAISIAALLLAVVPGAAYSAQTFHDVFRAHGVPYALSHGEVTAIDALRGQRGKILATPYLAAALPALVGRPSTPVGWSRGQLDELFAGRAGAPNIKQLIEGQRISTIVSDCLPDRADLSGLLRPLGFEARRYGCARIYRRPMA